jgi:serine protease AprX
MMVLVAVLVLAGATVTVFAGQGKELVIAPDLPFIGDADGNRLADDLDLKLVGANAGDKIPVVVMLANAPSDNFLAGLKSEVGAFETTAVWDLALNGFAADLTAGQINGLAHNKYVVRVDYDREYSVCMDKAGYWTGAQQARIDFGVDGDRDGNIAVFSTTDVVVCILDTGIDPTHVDLDGGKVIGWFDAINGLTTAYDDHGHGSHCSGIATGSGHGNSAYTGVAPGASLVGVKVLNSNGSGTTTQIVNGINWMISNKSAYNIRIGSMSLGSSGSSDGTDAISVAVNNAVTNGIVMVVAAGNSGPATYTIGSPAAAVNAITVGALRDPGEMGWTLAYFSSRGPTADGRTKPEICTPGYYITSVKANSINQYVVMSGTSMATPFCSGLVALMLDANNSLTVSGVKSILYASGNVKDFGPAGFENDFGYGIALAYNDVKQAIGGTTSWSDGLLFNYNAGTLSATGAYVDYTFSVTDTTKPIGVTMVINSWSTQRNFDIYLYNPSGTQVASSITKTRQETINYQPTVTGTYKLRVKSIKGSGTFWANTSWK